MNPQLTINVYMSPQGVPTADVETAVTEIQLPVPALFDDNVADVSETALPEPDFVTEEAMSLMAELDDTTLPVPTLIEEEAKAPFNGATPPSPDVVDADIFPDDDDGELPSPDLPDELEE